MAHEQDMKPGDPSMNDAEDLKLKAALDHVAAMEREDDAAEADAAWKRFENKLAAREAGTQDFSASRPRPTSEAQGRTSIWRRIRTPRTGVGWLATAQAAAIAAMAFVLIPQGSPSQPDEYRTLSSDDPELVAGSTGNAVLVFDESVNLATINETLTGAGARIVDGPMANGGYMTQIDEGRLESAIEELTANDSVVLVEALVAESPAEEQP
jgi:HAMP domain-containing protein